MSKSGLQNPTAAGSSPMKHAEHFMNLDQQSHASRLGMWVFLGSETMLFAALFGLFWGYRGIYYEAFEEAAQHNLVLLGTGMTLVLLFSSFLVAWSIHSVQRGQPRIAAYSLVLTVLLGLVFLGLKGYEYTVHFREGLYPGVYYSSTELTEPGHKLFFTLYYFLSGLHALHVIAGMIILGALGWLVHKGRYTPLNYTSLENGGLYWHLVDIIWLFLWPMLYLV